MPRLPELLDQSRSRLVGFAEFVQDRLTQELVDTKEHQPVYAIKYRIKSHNSIVGKLHSKLQFDEALTKDDKIRINRLLYENITSLNEIRPYIMDLVGIRVIWLFDEAKQDFAEKMILQSAAKWFQIAPKENGDPWVDIKTLTPKKDARPSLGKFVDDGSEKPKEKRTHYTSIHIMGSLHHDTAPALYQNLACELQLRTLLEEAWGEVSHYLVYKGISENDARKKVGEAKVRHFSYVENDFQAVYSSVKELRSFRLHPVLQLAQHYPLDSQGRLGLKFIGKHEDAYADRVAGNYDASIQKLDELLQDIDRNVPSDAVVDLSRRIRCDMAACHLHERHPASQQRAEASIALAKNSKGGSNSFWANFRESELHRQRRKFSDAIQSCEKALSRLKTQGAVTWCSTTGLEADVLCYLGSIYWSKAYWEYHEAHDPKVLSVHNTAGADSLALAVNYIRQASELAMQDAAVSTLIQSRCNSLLLTLLIWQGHREGEVVLLLKNVQNSAEPSPGDLGRRAWAILMGVGGPPFDRLQEARDLCTKAQAICNSVGQPAGRHSGYFVRTSLRIGVVQRMITAIEANPRLPLDPLDWFMYYSRS